MPSTLTPEPEPMLYEAIAGEIAALIDRGTLRAGDRLPSVRKLSRQRNASISTILSAYRVLEDRKRIVARPQSGYYVRTAPAAAPREPQQTRPPMSATRVSVHDMVRTILEFAGDENNPSFGGAEPGLHCLPTLKLNRIQASLGRRARFGMNRYELPPGCKELRNEIARRMIEAGCALSPDEIITTCGCQEAISICLRAVAEPGSIIAIESPTFFGHLQAIEALGLRAIEMPTCPREGMCLDSLERLLRRRKIAAVLCNPSFQNPLGFVMPDEKKQRLVRMLEAQSVPLIEDDVYGDLGFSGRPHACKSYDRAGNVLLCSSFSKTLAPGARVGWCAPGRFRDQVLQIRVAMSICAPTLPQRTIGQFLATGGYDRHLRRARRIYEDQVNRYYDAIARLFPPGTRSTRPAGGYVLWVELDENFDAVRLQQRALREKISISPGPMFSASRRYRNCLRMNCAPAWGRPVENALERLAHLIREMR